MCGHGPVHFGARRNAGGARLLPVPSSLLTIFKARTNHTPLRPWHYDSRGLSCPQCADVVKCQDCQECQDCHRDNKTSSNVRCVTLESRVQRQVSQVDYTSQLIAAIKRLTKAVCLQNLRLHKSFQHCYVYSVPAYTGLTCLPVLLCFLLLRRLPLHSHLLRNDK